MSQLQCKGPNPLAKRNFWYHLTWMDDGPRIVDDMETGLHCSDSNAASEGNNVMANDSFRLVDGDEGDGDADDAERRARRRRNQDPLVSRPSHPSGDSRDANLACISFRSLSLWEPQLYPIPWPTPSRNKRQML
jgi:hypothetical protein